MLVVWFITEKQECVCLYCIVYLSFVVSVVCLFVCVYVCVYVCVCVFARLHGCKVGDGCMGRPPPQILGGQSPLGLRPWIMLPLIWIPKCCLSTMLYSPSQPYKGNGVRI